MSVSVGKIVDQVNTKILEGGQDVIDAARLVGSIEALESRFSVANIAALPPAADNTGRFIYVDDIEAYRYSDGTQWTNDYDTTLTATSGQLWAWGVNTFGQIGDGTTITRCSPVREFYSATDWQEVSSDFSNTAALKTSGEIWTWGRNLSGQLGDGTTTDKCLPVREICSATDWCRVSSSGNSISAIKKSGELWSWGSNFCGALGNGLTSNSCSPVREICSASNWCYLDAGTAATFAIKTSGELWAWGRNICGRLGNGTFIASCSPIKEFYSATDWCQVSSGSFSTAAVKTSGELWTWGINSNGNLGDGTTILRTSPVREFCSSTDWQQVSVLSLHTSAVKTSGQIWSWGYNGCGRLGDGTLTRRCSPVREFCSATDWCQISSGSYHTSAVKTSGQLWSWGFNGCGQFGDGTLVTRFYPVQEMSSSTDWCQVSAGCNHTTAVKVTRGFNEP